MSMTLRPVTKEQFFAPIFRDQLEVHPSIVTRFPFTSEWRFHRQLGVPLYGKTVDRVEGGVTVTVYLLAYEATT